MGSEAADTRLAVGTIVLPEAFVPRPATRVVVRLEDVSRADAPAVVVAEVILRPDPGRPLTRLPFELTGPPPPRGRYALRIHVDADGSGAIDIGDFVGVITPATPGEAGHGIVIGLRRVA
jgi:uncharacterized lipoprotein YbaY